MRRVVEVDAELLQRSAVVTPRGTRVCCHLEIDALPASRQRCERRSAWYQRCDEHNEKTKTHPHDARHPLWSQGDRTAQRVCTTPEGVLGVERKQARGTKLAASVRTIFHSMPKKNYQKPRLCEAFPTFRASSTMTSSTAINHERSTPSTR